MIPASSAEITPDWLSGVLDRGSVVDVRAEDLGAGLGLLGEVSRLRLTWADGGSGDDRPATIIAKLTSPAPESAFVAQLMGFYDREVSFYRSVADGVPVRVPRCFHADIAADGVPFVLLLEDVTGARTVDQIAGASRADTEAVVDEAVRLHAMFWDDDDLRALDWLPPMNSPLFLAAAGLADEKMADYLAYWDGKAPVESIRFVQDMTPNYPALLEWWGRQGNETFVHMDYRADNFLFGGSAGDGAVTILDWQLSLRGAGVWDVANFLAASVTPENRRAWEGDLVRRYHDGLLAAGVDGYDFDRCWRDYRYSIGQQAWSTLPMGDLDPGNDRGRLLLDTITPRYLVAAADLDVAEMLALF